MKKQLLIAAALLVSAGAFAQGGRKAALNKPIKAGADAVVNENNFPVAGTKGTQGPTTPPHVSSVCNPVRFTSCVNAFAVGGGTTTYMQNCLSYNKDINAVLWTSRVSQDWSFPGKTSGAIQATWLNLANSQWDSMIIYRDSTNGAAARYPGGIFFNPTGNTSISGAQAVGTGPITGGAGWLGVWYASRQPSGTYTTTGIPNSTYTVANGAAPFGNVGNGATNAGFLNQDITQAGQTVFVTGAMWDYANSTESKGAILAKGTFSGNTLNWSADSIVPGFLTNAGGIMTDFRGARLAFDPSGTIGYMVFNGRLATSYGNSADSTMMPVVYKSTDGGATWAGPIMAGYDWRVQHPELLKNVGVLLGTPAHRVTPNLQHGIDVTVDANGVLHYVTTLTMPYKDGDYAGGGFDSLQYTYTYKWDYDWYHPIVWDLMTDGTCWKTMLVDSLVTAYVGGDPANDTTASFNAWLNGATYLPYGAHLTVSRSSDGNVVFYGWGDSDPNVTGTPFNTQPDMIMKAFDVSTNMVSATTNVTNGIGTCFFSYLSDVSYFDSGTNNWVVPFVYTVGRVQSSPGVYDGIGPVDYYYGDCATFNSTNINIPATINNETSGVCAIGIKHNNNYAVAVNNFPNPFNHSTNIVVTLNDAKALDLKVYNAMGMLVYSKKMNGNVGENTFVFDGSALASGVYHYTVSAGNEKVTKKMVIQK